MNKYLFEISTHLKFSRYSDTQLQVHENCLNMLKLSKFLSHYFSNKQAENGRRRDSSFTVNENSKCKISDN